MASTPLSKRIRSNGKNEEEESNSFKTPVMKRLKLSSLTPGKSPAFEIPPSPSLKQLGFGTGLVIFLTIKISGSVAPPLHVTNL